MSYSSYRGTVGLVKPTMRPGVHEDLIRALPEGICMIPLFNDVRRGALDEFEAAIAAYREKAEVLAQQNVDLIFLSGAPPFMVLGHEKELALMRDWEAELGMPVVTSAVNQIEAFKALGVRRSMEPRTSRRGSTISSRAISRAPGSSRWRWRVWPTCPSPGCRTFPPT